MPVDCVHQMLMTSTRGVEAKTCGIRNQPCSLGDGAIGICLCKDEPDPNRKYRRNLIAYDVPDSDETITIQVGSELWKKVWKQ